MVWNAQCVKLIDQNILNNYYILWKQHKDLSKMYWLTSFTLKSQNASSWCIGLLFILPCKIYWQQTLTHQDQASDTEVGMKHKSFFPPACEVYVWVYVYSCIFLSICNYVFWLLKSILAILARPNSLHVCLMLCILLSGSVSS